MGVREDGNIWWWEWWGLSVQYWYTESVTQCLHRFVCGFCYFSIYFSIFYKVVKDGPMDQWTDKHTLWKRRDKRIKIPLITFTAKLSTENVWPIFVKTVSNVCKWGWTWLLFSILLSMHVCKICFDSTSDRGRLVLYWFFFSHLSFRLWCKHSLCVIYIMWKTAPIFLILLI